MHREKLMRKAGAEERMIFLIGVIMISIIAIVLVIRMMAFGLESTREGQEKVLANMIAISVNTLSTMDQGVISKDFGMKEPMILEIYKKSSVNYVKVTYDSNVSRFYEAPLLVDIDPVAPTRLQRVSVIKDITGKIQITGEIRNPNLLYNPYIECTEPSPEDKKQYINDAMNQPEVQKYGIDQTWIKAVIRQESSFMHCENGHVRVSDQGALGLMQLMPKTASGLGVDPRIPKENVMGGTRYLAQLKNQYSGDMDKTLAAYNWGTENFKAVKDYPDWKNKLPKQTSDFIAKVNGYYKNCYAVSICNPKECVVC
jgi:hypothetical protein